MIKRLIIFLVRKRLGLKKDESFQFVGQKSDVDFYYFTSDAVMKFHDNSISRSSVSLNWLLDDECKIRKW